MREDTFRNVLSHVEIYGRNSWVLEPARLSRIGRIGSVDGNVFLENVRQRDVTVYTSAASGRTRTD